MSRCAVQLPYASIGGQPPRCQEGELVKGVGGVVGLGVDGVQGIRGGVVSVGRDRQGGLVGDDVSRSPMDRVFQTVYNLVILHGKWIMIEIPSPNASSLMSVQVYISAT